MILWSVVEQLAFVVEVGLAYKLGACAVYAREVDVCDGLRSELMLVFAAVFFFLV